MNTTPKHMELDHREADGVSVTLSWDCAANRVVVSVVEASGGSFELTVEDANALDAFRHPYAYAAFRGLLRREPQPVAA